MHRLQILISDIENKIGKVSLETYVQILNKYILVDTYRRVCFHLIIFSIVLQIVYQVPTEGSLTYKNSIVFGEELAPCAGFKASRKPARCALHLQR